MDIGFAAMRLEARLNDYKMRAYTTLINILARNAAETTLQAALRAATVFDDDDQIDMLRKVGYALLDRPGVLPPAAKVEKYKESALASVAVALANAGKVSEAKETIRKIADVDISGGAARGIAVALGKQGELAAVVDTVTSIPNTEGWHIFGALRDLTLLLNHCGTGTLRMRLFNHACCIQDIRARCEAIAVCSVMFSACSDVKGMELAYDHAKAVPWESDRAELFAALAQGFASLQHRDGINLIADQLDNIKDPWARAHTLTGLAQAFAKIKDLPALKVLVESISRLEEKPRETPLIAVSRAFLEVGSFDGIRFALKVAIDIGDDFSRANSIGGPHLVTRHPGSTIHSLYSEGEAWYGIATCAAKAGLTGEVRKSLETVQAIHHDWSRDIGQTGVLLNALDLRDDHWSDEILVLVPTIKNADFQAKVLSKMSEVSISTDNSSQLTRCLTAAEHINDPAGRARALGPICMAMLRIGDNAGVNKCLTLVERYTYEAAKADAVEGVLPVLVQSKDVGGLRRMAAAASTVNNESSRYRALSASALAMARAGMPSEAKALARQLLDARVNNNESWALIVDILLGCQTADMLEAAFLAIRQKWKTLVQILL
jgi:hypothetical protein